MKVFDLAALIEGVDERAVVGAQHAALVGHADPGDALAQAVHGKRRYPAEQRVVALAPIGADVVVARADRGDEARDLLGRILQVGIERHGDAPAHVLEPREDRHVLAEIAVEEDHPGRVGTLVELRRQHLRRSIAAAVVDEDDLVALAGVVEHAIEPLEQRGQDVFLVVDRHDDGDLGYHEESLLQASSRAAHTRSTSPVRIAGKSGSVRIPRPMRSARGSIRVRQPAAR